MPDVSYVKRFVRWPDWSRLGTLDRYLIRELWLTTVAVAVVLLAILISTRLARMLAQALAGELPATAVLAVVAWKMVQKLSVVLPLAVFLAQLLVLGRLSRDHELAAMAASGYGPPQLLRVLLLACAPWLAMTAVLTLWLSPLAVGESLRAVDLARSQAQVTAYAAGRFTESGPGGRVFYVESMDAGGARLRNVFIYAPATEQAPSRVLTAQAAVLEAADDGGRFLILAQGHRYDGTPMRDGFRTIRFDRHGVLIRPGAVAETSRREAVTTAQLLDDATPAARVELYWRVFYPVLLVVLTVFAVAVGRAPPRYGRYARIPHGIAVYAVYVNLNGIGRAWAEQGGVSAAISGWWVHALALLVAVGWWMWRDGALMGRRRSGGLWSRA